VVGLTIVIIGGGVTRVLRLFRGTGRGRGDRDRARRARCARLGSQRRGL